MSHRASMEAESASITVEGLTKVYNGRAAVNDLSFTVRPGAVTGFLGPNGAGKTTTLSMLMGLVKPTSGAALIGDRPYAQHGSPGRLIGSAIDPGFHPGRSGLAHLRSYAPLAGADTARCNELLELVGLTDAASKKVGGYSMGMKQRLALATALLGDPPILVLDEPANGLDPQGIAWLRSLLKKFAAEGRTVLVSSHVLSEVQSTVDDVVIIALGRLVHASPLRELADLAETRTYVASPQAEQLRDLVEARGWKAEPHEKGVMVQEIEPEVIGDAAYAVGLPLHRLETRDVDLEQVFFRLTDPRNAPAPAAAPHPYGPAATEGVA